MIANRIYVLTQPFRCDAGLAIAANRAGSVGILDLSCAHDDQAADELRRLKQHLRRPRRWGVRLNPGSAHSRVELLETVADEDSPIPLVIVAEVDFSEDLKGICRAYRTVARDIVCEVYSAEQARQAAEAGFDRVLLKGSAASGRVSAQTSFMLLQSMQEHDGPWLLQGGVGPETAAAALVAGACGVVVSEQLWLAAESPLDRATKERLARMDGSETAVVTDGDQHHRFLAGSGRDVLTDLERRVAAGASLEDEVAEHRLRAGTADLFEADGALVPLGQDVGLAATDSIRLAVAELLRRFCRRTRTAMRAARDGGVIRAGSEMAQSLQTEYPVLQGPMTRVSDVAGFSAAVSQEGGLPFLALALLRGPQVRSVLTEAAEENKGRSWGAGILGFVPAELRKEQFAVVEEIRPPFAIIAGGRPSQATRLESLGIRTFLHVPSPGLLDAFLSQGARRFIFEGRECGGHVGPRDSFTLWQQTVNRLHECSEEQLAELEIVFAGGIHDPLSSAMVSVITSSLAERGVRVGVLMGTAYLFTEEAVATGAIGHEFQSQAIECSDTILLRSGIGHETRCAPTAFADEFETQRSQMLRDGRSADEIREELEVLNIGRLRLASKGVERTSDPGSSRRGELVEVDREEQRQRGMYMIGEVAAFHQKTTGIRQLHESVTTDAVRICESRTQDALTELLPARSLRRQQRRKRRRDGDLAIVGMAGVFPEAADLRQFWSNIVNQVDSVREVPADRWDIDAYFDADPQARDKVYSRWGGFLSASEFDPMKWGMPPSTLASIDPIQLLSLEVAWRATVDAGMHLNQTASRRTSVIFAAAGISDFGADYLMRSSLRNYLPLAPSLTDEQREQVIADLEARLPEWTEDSFPGFLLNVVAGRIANRLDFSGANFTVDAACAGSLAALHVAVNQLRVGEIDSAVVGAVDICNNPFAYLSFAKTHALSPRGRSRPFDADSDGIALGEAVVSLVIKRLEDAERDGDRIYSVLRGVGFSSDGRNRSMTAPYPVGQRKAMLRAYRDAGYSPKSVGLFEAHGTGTSVGDLSEVTSLLSVLPEKAGLRRAALGSVKSNIGHTKAAAGLVSVIKASLALNQRILPPTIGVTRPHEQLLNEDCPLYVNTESRPWSTGPHGVPRRASVSSFGFGGTNFHVALEEYRGDFDPRRHVDLYPRSCELIALTSDSRTQLQERLTDLTRQCGERTNDDFRVFAADWSAQLKDQGSAGCRLLLVAADFEQLAAAARKAARMIESGDDPDDGVELFFGSGDAISADEVCFLYPGQGSQTRYMLKDLITGTSFAGELLSEADQILTEELGAPISEHIYPSPAFDRDVQQHQLELLSDTSITQPALAVVEAFGTQLLQRFNIRPGFAAGHSFGEYTALWAAGVWTFEDFLKTAAARGRICQNASNNVPGAMAVVYADAETTEKLIQLNDLEVDLANLNGPQQTVIAGLEEQIERAVSEIDARGYRCTRLKVSAAFHTKHLKTAAAEFSGTLAETSFSRPAIRVGSNTLAGLHDEDPESIRRTLVDHLTTPVQFERMVRDLVRQPVRLFVEVGPRQVLSGLVRRIADSESATVLTLDTSGEDKWEHLARLLGRCFALGLPVRLAEWYAIRSSGTPDVVASGPTPLPAGVKRAPVWTLSPTRPVNPAKSGRAPESTSHPSEITKVNQEAVAADPPQLSDVAGLSSQSSQAVSRNDGQPSGVRVVRPGQILSFSATSPTTQIDHGMNSATAPEYQPATENQSMIPQEPESRPGMLPPASIPSSTDALSESTSILERWLQLQIEQQRVMERLLALHERLQFGDVARPLPAVMPTSRPTAAPVPAAVAPAASTSVAPVAAAASPSMHPGSTVRPAPVVSTAVPAQSARPSPLPSELKPRAEIPAAPVSIQRPPTSTPRQAPAPVPPRDPVSGNGRPATAKTSEATDSAWPPVAEFQKDLLQIVSDRTGYPIEALDLTTPLESGLGIDSIKTVEIFSGLKRFHEAFQSDGEDEEDFIADFAKLKTLGAIVEFYAAKLPEAASGDVAGDADPVTRYEVTSGPAADKKKV